VSLDRSAALNQDIFRTSPSLVGKSHWFSLADIRTDGAIFVFEPD
jgi:hypothetical protein